MRLLVAMDFVDDADLMAAQRLAELGYKPAPGDTALDRFIALYTHAERTIPLVPYEVRLSDEIQQNPKYKTHRKAFDEIVSRLRKGESISPYLSKKAVRPVVQATRQDTLLLTWGIHHLHLNSIDTVDKRGYVERKRGKSELLLLRIEGRTAYLIDIISHSEPNLFDNPRLLEIVDRNWPALHVEAKAVTGETFDPAQIRNLRSNHANFLIRVNGRVIIPKTGVMATGIPFEVYRGYEIFHDELRNAEVDIRRRFYEFFPHSAPPSRSMSAIQNVKLIAIEPEFFVIQHREMKQICYARRSIAQE